MAETGQTATSQDLESRQLCHPKADIRCVPLEPSAGGLVDRRGLHCGGAITFAPAKRYYRLMSGRNGGLLWDTGELLR